MENSNTVKIFGVGDAGVKMLSHLAAAALPGVPLVALNTDGWPESVAATEKILLEGKADRGPGAGGDPERGRALAEQNLPRLKEACAGAGVVFIVTGLGGGAGTGVSPVLARVARESGALVLAFAALPFDCEGNRRRHQARQGLAELKAAADGVICLPNQAILKLIEEETSVLDTFRRANEMLGEGVAGVWRLLARRGLIEIHFADLCALLRDHHGESALATADAAGATRSREVVEKLLAHPMLEGGRLLAESGAVLVSLTGGSDLTMAEINRVMELIEEKCCRAEVLMGAVLDESFRERLAVTLIAAGPGATPPARAGQEPAEAPAARPAEGLDTQLLNRGATPRPQSRFVPPPPALPPERLQQLMARQSGTRGRRGAPKMRQEQLPLEIVSKGRFDKSEPTIHKGEDLDVPTYIRRGVALN